MGKLPPLASAVICKYRVAPNPINNFQKPSRHPEALLCPALALPPQSQRSHSQNQLSGRDLTSSPATLHVCPHPRTPAALLSPTSGGIWGTPVGHHIQQDHGAASQGHHPWDISGHRSGACVWAAGNAPEGRRVPAAPSLPRCSPVPGNGTGKEKFCPRKGQEAPSQGFILHGETPLRRDGKGSE